MRGGPQVIIAAAARFFTPLIALFAFALLAVRAPMDGIGFVAGLAFGLLQVLHALVFGAEAARAALPTPLARVMLGLGIVALCAGAGLPGFAFATQVIEAGAFVVMVAGSAIVVQTLFGRVPTLRDAE